MTTLLDFVKFPGKSELRLERIAQDISSLPQTEVVPHRNRAVQAIAERYAGEQAGVEVPMRPATRLSKIRDILYKRGAVDEALKFDLSLQKARADADASRAMTLESYLKNISTAVKTAKNISDVFGDKQAGADFLKSYFPELNYQVVKSDVVKDSDLVKYTDPATGIKMKGLLEKTPDGVGFTFAVPDSDPLYKGIEKYPGTLLKVRNYVRETGVYPPPATVKRWKVQEISEVAEARMPKVRKDYLKALTDLAKARLSRIEAKAAEAANLPPEIRTKVGLLVDEYKKLTTQLAKPEMQEREAARKRKVPLVGFEFESGSKAKKAMVERQKEIEWQIDAIMALAEMPPGRYEVDGKEVVWTGSDVMTPEEYSSMVEVSGAGD